MEVLHPKIVHIPLALALIMPLLGGALTLAWWRGWYPRRVWIIALVMHIALTASAFAAMQTGEDEEHTAEKVVGAAKISEHEEAAESFLLASVAALFLALIAAVAEDEEVALRFALATVVVASGSALLAIDTGDHGGRLVYKYGAARAFMPAQYGGLQPVEPHKVEPHKVELTP